MAYTVTLRPSGHTLTVEDDERVLEAALRQGFALPYGCRNGACGSCKARVLAGEVHYDGDLPPALGDSEDARGLALLCQARPLDDLEIEVQEIGAAKDIPIKTVPTRVVSHTLLGHDVMRLHLKLPAAERMRYLPGQYVDILLRDGRRRGFSMANPPHEDETLELHIRHVEGGSFTRWVFHEMKDKALLRIQGPLGTFFLHEDSDAPAILIGGGTGFAPLKAMLEHAFHTGIERRLHLYWGVRRERDLYLADLPEQWAKAHPNFSFTPIVSDPAPEDSWSGRTGWVHDAVRADHPDLSGHDVYAAGPPQMIDAIRRDLIPAGLSEDRLFYDSFDFAGDHSLREGD